MPKRRVVDPAAAVLLARAHEASGLTKLEFANDVLVVGENVLYRWLRGDSMPPPVVLNRCERVINPPT